MRNTRTTISDIDASLLGAVLDGNLEYTKMLITQYKANVNAQDAHGASPALYAAKRNDLNILKYLVEKGADLRLSDLLNKTPLSWAQYNKNDEMITFIEDQSKSSLTP